MLQDLMSPMTELKNNNVSQHTHFRKQRPERPFGVNGNGFNGHENGSIKSSWNSDILGEMPISSQGDDIAKASLNLVLQLLTSVNESQTAPTNFFKDKLAETLAGAHATPWLAISSPRTACKPSEEGSSSSSFPRVSELPSILDSNTVDDCMARFLSQTDKASLRTTAAPLIGALVKIVMLQACFIGTYHHRKGGCFSPLEQVDVNVGDTTPASDEVVAVDETADDTVRTKLQASEYDGIGEGRSSSFNFTTATGESAFEIPQIDLDDLLQPIVGTASSEFKCEGLCQRSCDISPCVQKCSRLEKLQKNVKCCIRQELLKLRSASCTASSEDVEEGTLRHKPRSSTDWGSSRTVLAHSIGSSSTQFVDGMDLRPHWMKEPRLFMHVMNKISSQAGSRPLFHVEWNILGLGKLSNFSNGSRIVSPRFEPTSVEGGTVKCPVLAPLRMMVTFDNNAKSTLTESSLRIGLGFTLAGDLDVSYRVFHPEYVSPPRRHSFRDQPWATVNCCDCLPLPLRYLEEWNVVTVGLIIEDLQPGGTFEKWRLADPGVNSVNQAVRFGAQNEAQKRDSVTASPRRPGTKVKAKSEDLSNRTKPFPYYEKFTDDPIPAADRLNHSPTNIGVLDTNVMESASFVRDMNSDNEFLVHEGDCHTKTEVSPINVRWNSQDGVCPQIEYQQLMQNDALDIPEEKSTVSSLDDCGDTTGGIDLPSVLHLLVGYQSTNQAGCSECLPGVSPCEACIANEALSQDVDACHNIPSSQDPVLRDVLNQTSSMHEPAVSGGSPEEEKRVTSLPLQTSLSKMDLPSLALEHRPVIRATKCLFNRIWKTKSELDTNGAET